MTPPKRKSAGKRRKAWEFHTRLSGSENHKGFILTWNDIRIGEIYPQDEDGIEGKANVERIVSMLNSVTQL